MAFGKKKQDEAPEEASVDAPALAADEAPAGDEPAIDSTLFAATPAPEDAIADAPEAGAPLEAAAAAPEGDALGGDLMNMFSANQIETADLSLMVEMAGEVELADLLEDLHTIAAALGVRGDAQEEYAAAA